MLLTPEETRRRESLRKCKPRVYDKVVRYGEKLARGESAASIQLQYSYACNFHCQHCSISEFRWQRKERKLTPADVADIARQADEMGLAQILVTGGEPLMFPDLDEVVAAIDPSKFYVQLDSNGWLLTAPVAHHLKEIGVDTIQLSLDSVFSDEHDAFRNKPGSHARAMRAVDNVLDAGLSLFLATVVTHDRLNTPEFLDLLEFARDKAIQVNAIWPKPVGEWTGYYNGLPTPADVAYMRRLECWYPVCTHTTPGYGLDLGCVAVKRMVSITQYGDVLPCIWMYLSLGNVFEEPLKDILERGMRYFGAHEKKCLMSESKYFLSRYVAKTYGRELPAPIGEIMALDWREGWQS